MQAKKKHTYTNPNTKLNMHYTLKYYHYKCIRKDFMTTMPMLLFICVMTKLCLLRENKIKKKAVK